MVVQLIWEYFTIDEDSIEWIDTKSGKRKNYDAKCILCSGIRKSLKCTHGSTTGIRGHLE